MDFILIPSTKGVALPAVEFSLNFNHKYLKNVQRVLLPGDKCVITYVKSMEPFDSFNSESMNETPVVLNIACLCEFMYSRRVSSKEGLEDIVEFVFKGMAPVTIDTMNYFEKEKLFRCQYTIREDIQYSDIELKRYDENIRRKYASICESYPVLKPLDEYEDLSYSDRTYVYGYEFGLNDNNLLRLLKETNPQLRYSIVLETLNAANIAPIVKAEIDAKTNSAIQRGQREYVLREQAKTIRQALKEFDGDDILDKYENAIEQGLKVYPQYVLDRIKSETSKLKLLGSASQESAMARNYLDLLVRMPWKVSTEDNDDLNRVREVLDEDHYGLKKQKERILEYLAVKTLTKSLKSPILCFYGPPGTGKTSLAISIARALNRKFVKFALGGVYDESEIRGHRRTYVGALPGRIINGIANSGTNNPVFLLDEIDKMAGGGYHGDPAAACLEILDPQQNVNFEDHYLDLPFDLSNVLFICTANDLSEIPAPLRDRLELIELNTYTLFEKIHIAKNHLIKQELEANGLTSDMISFTDESLSFIIDAYTREAGVRELRRKIGAIMRKFSVNMLSNKAKTPFVVTNEIVEEYLSKPIFFHTRPVEGQVGIVNGLAYTSYGGELLPIECNITKGSGHLIRTGNLGDVMKESMQIALSYVKVIAQKYGYGNKYFDTHDIHIHCPEGAIPKDGPSAGCALATVILSAVTNIPLNSEVAMTGEVDLRGNSMQIGGLREKTLAAVREHLKLVIIPHTNHNDYLELPEEIKNNIEIKEVKTVEEIIPLIFMKMPKEREIIDDDKKPKKAMKEKKIDD